MSDNIKEFPGSRDPGDRGLEIIGAKDLLEMIELSAEAVLAGRREYRLNFQEVGISAPEWDDGHEERAQWVKETAREARKAIAAGDAAKAVELAIHATSRFYELEIVNFSEEAREMLRESIKAEARRSSAPPDPDL